MASITSPLPTPADAAEVRRWRGGLITTGVVMVVITWLFLRDSSIGIQGFSLLLLLWILLGYATFFAATNAYGENRNLPRPDLSAVRGIPALVFFLAGGGLLILVSAAWFFWGNARVAMTILGISIGYLSVTYPRRLSIRRALISGLGLLVVAIGQLLA